MTFAATGTGWPSTEVITSPAFSSPAAGPSPATVLITTCTGKPSSRSAAVSALVCDALKSSALRCSTCSVDSPGG